MASFAPQIDYANRILMRPAGKSKVTHSPPTVAHMGRKGKGRPAPRRASMVPTVAGTDASVMK